MDFVLQMHIVDAGLKLEPARTNTDAAFDII
jgi:hypothetical protein